MTRTRATREHESRAPERTESMGFATALLILTKPRIVFSVAFTGFAGMVLAQRGLPGAAQMLLAMGALVLSAGAAALLNNIMDRQLDLQMHRLSRRVRALEIVGERRSFAVAMLFIAVSLAVAGYFFNLVYVLLLVLAILSYTPLYTLYLKRSSPFGTILGGIPGAMPVLAGYAAVDPGLGTAAWLLFAVMMLWQPPHFWALAQMYRGEYKSAGIPVLPVAYGTKYTNLLTMIYSFSLLPMTLSLWLFGFCSEFYAILAILVGVYFNYVVIKNVRENSGYKRTFGVSILYIMVIMAAVIADVALNPTGLVWG